jgi:hypothetical protein
VIVAVDVGRLVDTMAPSLRRYWQAGFVTVVLLLFAIAVSVAWLQVARTLTASTPAPHSHSKQTSGFAVVWSGTVYTSRARLRSALGQAGVSWSAWEAHHPGAFARKSRPMAEAAPPPVSSADSRRPLTIAFGVIGALLAFMALVPRPVAARFLSERMLQADYRTPLVAAAASIGVGVVIASLV